MTALADLDRTRWRARGHAGGAVYHRAEQVVDPILRTEPGTVARAGLVACALLAALSCFAWAEFTSCELQQACFT